MNSAEAFLSASVIDGTHISVTPPSKAQTNYYNQKGSYSVTLQGLADSKYLFSDIYILDGQEADMMLVFFATRRSILKEAKAFSFMREKH